MAIPLQVLILEDSENDFLLLLDAIRKAGFDPTHARVDTAQGLRTALATSAWDIIISDFNMPSFNAPTALEVLKESGLDIPMIISSGSIGEDIAVAALKAGARDFFLKSKLTLLGPAITREVHEARTRRQRREVEQALAASEARLEMILRSLPMVLHASAVHDFQTLLWISDNVALISGFRPDRFMSDREFWASRIHPADRERVERETALVHTKRIFATEYRWQCADDKYRWFLHQGVVAAQVAGKTDEILGTWLDISERKNLEMQFFQAQKMEAVGRLAGGVAHDFNNLLTVITGYSELLLTQLHNADPLRDLVEQIRLAGERAAQLTRQLLTFSRKQVLAPRTLELNSLFEHLETMLRRLIGEHIDLKFCAGPGLWTVHADPGQLEQVIMNLVVNARDAMPSGGKITVETQNIVLDEHYALTHADTQPGQYVLLAVSDTGCGMDEHLKAMIFEPFFTTKEPDKGTGLGLATVYGIVKQSNGVINVYSEVGRGSSFKVYLPRSFEQSTALKSKAGLTVAGVGTETILLVEDEEAVRNLARLVLHDKGYQLLIARHGAEALLLCEHHAGRVNLLVTDVVMPNMSGRQLFEQLHKAQPSLKVLYVSGYTDDAVVHHGVLDAGMPFLQKPFTPESLARKVREVLDQPAVDPTVD